MTLTAADVRVLEEVADGDGLYEEPAGLEEHKVLKLLVASGLVVRYRCKAIETFGNPEGWAYRTTKKGRQALVQAQGPRDNRQART